MYFDGDITFSEFCSVERDIFQLYYRCFKFEWPSPQRRPPPRHNRQIMEAGKTTADADEAAANDVIWDYRLNPVRPPLFPRLPRL